MPIVLDMSGLITKPCNRAVADCLSYTPGSGQGKFLRPFNRMSAELGTLDLHKLKAALRVIKCDVSFKALKPGLTDSVVTKDVKKRPHKQ
jgi:hypothetical protein